MQNVFPLIIRTLQQQPYQNVWQAMQRFTLSRTSETPDELWLVQHPAVFTQGQAGKAEHVLQLSDIPIVQTDRGGQVTYHGPGQLVLYTLINIKRLKLNIRQLVDIIETAVVKLLQDYQIKAYPKADAPGVYVNEQKICSLGLRIKKGCSYHGLALNIDMDLTPFSYINPCGYQGLQMTQMCDLHSQPISLPDVEIQLVQHISTLLGYNNRVFNSDLSDLDL